MPTPQAQVPWGRTGHSKENHVSVWMRPLSHWEQYPVHTHRPMAVWLSWRFLLDITIPHLPLKTMVRKEPQNWVSITEAAQQDIQWPMYQKILLLCLYASGHYSCKLLAISRPAILQNMAPDEMSMPKKYRQIRLTYLPPHLLLLSQAPPNRGSSLQKKAKNLVPLKQYVW